MSYFLSSQAWNLGVAVLRQVRCRKKAAVLAFCLCIPAVAGAVPGLEPTETLEVVRTIPHTGYSEGLDYHQGYLWHALPKELLKIDPKDGQVVARFKPATEYSESLTWFQGALWNVSYSDNGLYRAGSLPKANAQEAQKIDFKKRGTVPEPLAWGITHNGTHLIVTGNYSRILYFLSPANGKVVRTITTTVNDLEDLAWDGKYLWSSSFTQHAGKIFSIEPTTGVVKKFYALPAPEACPIIDGIAYDGKGFWITGKNCVSIYYVKKPK